MNNQKIETIRSVEYYKVTSEDLTIENFIMVLNGKDAYQLQNDGKWLFKPGLYDYLFNNDDSLDRVIEPLNLQDAYKEGIARAKKLGSKL